MRLSLFINYGFTSRSCFIADGLYPGPCLVKMHGVKNESGANHNQLEIPNVYTAIW